MTPGSTAVQSSDAVAPWPPPSRQLLGRALIIGVAPVVAYGAIRPFVGSDTVSLAIAGAIPTIYAIVLTLLRRRMDRIALLASIGYALGCLCSLLLGGNSLPLKLHEAFITFIVGVVLLIAVVIHRPLPIGRLFKLPTEQLNSALGVMAGGFLVLHALLHVALAVVLSTGSYLVASRIVNGGTIALGVLFVSADLRRWRDS